MDSSPAPAFAEDRPVPWLRRGLGAALLPLGWFALWLAHFQPAWVEANYSNGLFPRVRDLLRLGFGSLPFDGAQVLLLLLAVVLPLSVVRGLLGWLKRERSLANLVGHGATRLLSTAGVLYAFFLFSWGFNHARLPYARITGLELAPAPVASLHGMLDELVVRCNQLRAVIRDEQLSLASSGADPRVLRGYAELGTRVPTLRSGQPLVRQAFLSPLLSALGISGIYSPFSAEAHVNVEMPRWRHSFVSAHEIAHFKGFAREDEANFIAWQVCRASGDPALEYSATLTATLHCLKALGRVDSLRADWLRESLSDAVRADLEWSQRFWQEKRTSATEVAKVANDTYLKSQGQAAGRQSYGRMVDLLIAEWRGTRPASGGGS